MSQVTRNEPEDRDPAEHSLRGTTLSGKTRAVIPCRLCGETIVLESNFRRTPAVCPHCGLKFVFDPQAQPLPVRGMRLRWSEVEAAHHRGSSNYQRLHAAHVAPPLVVPHARTSYLAWLGTLVIALAGCLALLGWLRR